MHNYEMSLTFSLVHHCQSCHKEWVIIQLAADSYGILDHVSIPIQYGLVMHSLVLHDMNCNF